MRRGEALVLRWRDVDLDAGRLQVRRSVGTVNPKGAGDEPVEGPTTTGQARVVGIDADTVAALRAYRGTRAGLAAGLVQLRAGPREPRRHPPPPRAVLRPVRRAGPPGTQGTGGG